MPHTLLRTKLFVPPLRPQLVTRPHLIERLNEGVRQGHKLTLISAPAGFGKSTLIAEWAGRFSQSVVTANVQPAFHKFRLCWISLDEGDNDLMRFLTYLIASLQTIDQALGQGVLVALQSPGEVNTDDVLTNLLNEISELKDGVVLILDDYHVIESPPVDQALSFLVEHLPAQIHVVLMSRIDPSLPLSRWRARGQMNEIRAHQLRFSTAETAAFLNQGMGFTLSTAEIAALESRTEGWIAGLHLAALSMQGLKAASEINEFVQRFTGSNRYIQDYLADEVLQQRPKGTQEFLLQTSILRRLSGPLCDAIRFGNSQAGKAVSNTAAPAANNSQTILENLDAANLFIIPLDSRRGWYRYHHLFADLLAQRLRQTSPTMIATLHMRASAWHENSGNIDEALFHAQAAADSARVVAILENHWQDIVHRGELARLKELLDALGPAITKNSAPLSMAYCWISNLSGSQAGIPEHLADIRAIELARADAATPPLPMKLAVIPSLVQTMEAIIALDNNKAEEAKAHAQQAISLIPDHARPAARWLLHGAAGYRLAEAHRALGEYDQAVVVLLEVLKMLMDSENYIGMASAHRLIVDIYLQSGQVRAAITLCENTLSYAESHRWQKMAPLGIVHLLLAGLQAQVGDMVAARRNFDVGRQLVEPIKTQSITNLLQEVTGQVEGGSPSSQLLVEPLSDRELEVLQLVAQGLSNREIGDRLYLALDTIKGHNRNIYSKLGVKNRAQAVNKAIALNILPPQQSQ